MKINSAALSLTVTDVAASSAFMKKHFGFSEKWSTDEFAYLTHENLTDQPIIYLKSGENVLPASIRNQKAEGVIIAFVVDDLETEEERLKSEGVDITEPIIEDPWGERLFQVTDPNGVTVQLVQWVKPSDDQYNAA
jgi:predicted enzyme related to lactoylglutathione lyase